MYNILEHMSSCTESDPRFIQLCLAISSGLIWHLWELLAFICFELSVSFASSYQIRRYSRQLLSSSLPPCHWWFYIYLTLFFSHIYFFFRLKTSVGCLSIPFAVVVLSSFHFLLYPFRLEGTIKHSRCRHAINLHMIQSVFFSCLHCFQFSCPFLVLLPFF